MTDRELQLFRNRLSDLAGQCEDRNIATHTHFLTVEEQRLAEQFILNVDGVHVISDGVFVMRRESCSFFCLLI